MWIGNVELPEELVEAAEAGELVLFVGAGASLAPPANLLTFSALVEEIGKELGKLPTEADLKSPDRFLGDLEADGADVHGITVRMLEEKGTSPNSLHEALVELAFAHGRPRIVTTNYDRNLEEAAKRLERPLEIYKAPALPMGDDFEGLVHLHGSLGQEPRRLVLTGGDFGKAYLLDSWASRFVARMFARYSVLFVGYSHGDVVMQYIARGLGPTDRRFALTSRPDNEQWHQHGVTPIGYAVKGQDHSELVGLVKAWGEFAGMGQLDHKTRIRRLVLGKVPSIPEEISHLEKSIRKIETLTYFLEHARGLDWLHWGQIGRASCRERV